MTQFPYQFNKKENISNKIITNLKSFFSFAIIFLFFLTVYSWKLNNKYISL